VRRGGTNQVGHCCAVAFSSSVGCLTTIFFESVAEPPDMRMVEMAEGRRRPMLASFPAGTDEANAGAGLRRLGRAACQCHRGREGEARREGGRRPSCIG
jgi:hypothetical protein